MDIESLIDVVTDDPTLTPDGWEMANDQCLVSPNGVWLIELEAGAALPGSFTISVKRYPDSSSNGPDEAVAELRVTDPRLAIRTAVAVDAWWQEEEC